MTKNPIINALTATVYIGVINWLISWMGRVRGPKPDSIFAPVLFLSMLVFSVCLMALVFFYQPLMMFVKGQKPEALKLFARTVGIFGIITLFFLLVVIFF